MPKKAPRDAQAHLPSPFSAFYIPGCLREILSVGPSRECSTPPKTNAYILYDRRNDVLVLADVLVHIYVHMLLKRARYNTAVFNFLTTKHKTQNKILRTKHKDQPPRSRVWACHVTPARDDR